MKKLASFDDLKEARRPVRTAWLSSLEDAEDLLDILGGDACIHGYTAAQWTDWQNTMKFDDQGNLVPDLDLSQAKEFMACLRQGEEPEAPPVFPPSREALDWIRTQLSPHVLNRIVSVADELSGWKMGWDPFGKRGGGKTKPSSAIGPSAVTEEVWPNLPSP